MKTPAESRETNDASNSVRRRLRCAIYTRKSSEEGLAQEFNSLDAQREACEAYILSQKHDGWSALPTYYDDGGLSGGNMERPALKRLLEDVAAGKVDVIVVYKVDRLTRSLADFAKIVDTLDKHQVSFVSVTQHFNTTSSMGRLTLNVLLSFAQFEREIAGERIRDKIAASKRKGMWMGGTIPFGYEVKDRRLEIVESEAITVRLLFTTYAALGTVEALTEYLIKQGITNVRAKAKGNANDKRGGMPDANADFQTLPTYFSRGALHHMLKNPLYIGRVTHKTETFKGLHQPIIDDALWTKVQQQIAQNTNNHSSGRRSKHPSLLVGKIETSDGQILTPTHTVKRGVRYRYYADFRASSKVKAGSNADKQNGTENSKDGNSRQPIIRIPAPAIESLVTDRLLTLLRSQTELADMFQTLNLSASQLREVIQNAHEIADRWSSKSAAEQRAVLQAVLLKVRLRSDHVELQLLRRGIMQVLLPATKQQVDKADDNASLTLNQHDGHCDSNIVCIKTDSCLEPSGNGIRLIISDTNQTTPNMHLAPLLGEAFMLREELLNGLHDSVEAMSKALQTSNGYITSRIRLTYLSPKIISNILNGAVPSTLTPTKLLEGTKELPTKWSEQDRFIEALAHQRQPH